MKHQFLLFLALLGAVLLWPGCDDDGVDVTCEVDVPFISFSNDCTPDAVNLTNLSGPQTGRLPALPTDGCSRRPQFPDNPPQRLGRRRPLPPPLHWHPRYDQLRGLRGRL